MPASYSYWRRVPGGGPDQQLQLQVEGESSASDQVTFEVPPSLEGLYYCMNGNSTSVNQLEIVGEPLLTNTAVGNQHIKGLPLVHIRLVRLSVV